MPGGGGKGGKGGGTSNVNVKSTSTSANTMDILGLDDIQMSTKLEVVKPIEMKQRSELAVTQPIRTEMSLDIKPLETSMKSDMSVDVKPVVMDLCLTLKVGDVPEMCISRPYDHEFSLTVMGTQLFSLNFAGERRTVVEHLPPKPVVAWGSESAVRHVARPAHSNRPPGPSTHGPAYDPGITIQLGPDPGS